MYIDLTTTHMLYTKKIKEIYNNNRTGHDDEEK